MKNKKTTVLMIIFIIASTLGTSYAVSTLEHSSPASESSIVEPAITNVSIMPAIEKPTREPTYKPSLILEPDTTTIYNRMSTIVFTVTVKSSCNPSSGIACATSQSEPPIIPISGANIILSGVAVGRATTNDNGKYVFTVNPSGSGTITASASKDGYNDASITISVIDNPDVPTPPPTSQPTIPPTIPPTLQQPKSSKHQYNVYVDHYMGFGRVTEINKYPITYNNNILIINRGDSVKWTIDDEPIDTELDDFAIIIKKDNVLKFSGSIGNKISPSIELDFDIDGIYDVYIKNYPNFKHQTIIAGNSTSLRQMQTPTPIPSAVAISSPTPIQPTCIDNIINMEKHSTIEGDKASFGLDFTSTKKMWNVTWYVDDTKQKSESGVTTITTYETIGSSTGKWTVNAIAISGCNKTKYVFDWIVNAKIESKQPQVTTPIFTQSSSINTPIPTMTYMSNSSTSNQNTIWNGIENIGRAIGRGLGRFVRGIFGGLTQT